jgi:DNA-binding NtrC family response regulator
LSDLDTSIGRTLHDASRRPPSPREARLVYIGSPEDGFAGGGRWWPLQGLDRVEFRRASAPELAVERDGETLRLLLPLPWVSSEHADLDLAGAVPVLVDRGSRNGTLVEGYIVDRAELVEAEVFEIGRTFWTIRTHLDATERSQTLDDTGVANPTHAEALHALERLAPTRVPILLVGETGTGKDYIADAIHRAAGRGGPLVRFNVLVHPVELGSASPFEAARGGTLLLDDVGELPLDRQGQLVTALLAHLPADEGGLALAPDGVRLLASTTRDVRAMVATEEFRPDLYARLAGFECHVPPLRARREDLGLLVRALGRDATGAPVGVAIEVFRAILAHGWPFNVRELLHCLEASIALRAPAVSSGAPEGSVTVDAWTRASWRASDVPTPARIASVRQTLVRELAQHRGDTRKVARSLKCELADIERWLQRFALEPEAYAP